MTDTDGLPIRRPTRLAEYDYSSDGAYFLTVCAFHHKCIFSSIVGGGVLDAPLCELSSLGKVIEANLLTVIKRYHHLILDHYVIMPNHIHILLHTCGASRTPLPTSPPVNRKANAVIPALIGTWKRFSQKEAGCLLFQRSYYDHVIRNEHDFFVHWDYIEHNPARWLEDELYLEETEKCDVCR